MDEDIKKQAMLEQTKHTLKFWAVALSELVLAGCLVNGVLPVLLVWFTASCIESAWLLSVAKDEDGSKLSIMKMMNEMSADKCTEKCKKLAAAERDKRWLSMCAWILATACAAKLLAMLLARWLGVTVSTWL